MVKEKQGFTLIELLVVISVIGLLASVIVVSLVSVRTKARDARVITDLNQIRQKTGPLILTTDGNYANVVNNSEINTLISDINAQGVANANIRRYGNAAGYCLEAQLPGGKWGCVNSGLTAVYNLASDPACNGANDNGPPSDINCQ